MSEHQLKGFSLLTEEVFEIGPRIEDMDDFLQLADTVATNRPDLVVFIDQPAVLQKWSSL